MTIRWHVGGCLFLTGVLTVLLLGRGLQAGPASPASPTGLPEPAGSAAVELKVVKYDELAKVVRSHVGKVVLVDVWGSFCAPCKAEFPHLIALHRAYAGKGLVCISVTVDDAEGRPAALKFLKSKNANFLNLALDEKPSVWQERWGGKGSVPIVFVFDRQGKRVAKLDNDDPDNQFTYLDTVVPLVKKLLNER